MSSPKLLIVDDEADMRWVLRGVFEDEDFELIEAANGREALDRFTECAPDVVLTDVVMPGMDGQELLRRCHQLDPELPVIMISALEDIEVAVRAMKDGAYDYLAKPFDRDRLLVTIRRAMEQRQLRRELADLRGQLAGQKVHFGVSEAALNLDRMVQMVARQTGVSVLLAGESGTGKEVVAREIHRRAAAADSPFVAIDCGALPEQLMESQLFGHKRGAFTGADRDREGLFRMADGGTLFLDELGNLPLSLQAKLLRALQERCVTPVGGGDPQPFDARLIAATNASLPEAVDAGEFRLDLYHRINEFEVLLPALRERPEDIPHFAMTFLTEANRDMGRKVSEISSEAMAALQAYPWPGNLRELRNAVRRALVVCGGHELGPGDLNLGPSPQPAGVSLLDLDDDMGDLSLKERVRRASESLEAQIIRAALDASEGNKAAAARALQIDYTTLHRKLKKFGLLPS